MAVSRFAHHLRSCMLLIPPVLRRVIFKPWYDAALHFFCRRLQQIPGVCEIYLSGSGARQALSYGVSDLDFFLIIRADTDELLTRGAVKTVLMKYRRFFPMLQPVREISVFSAEEMQHVFLQRRPHLLSLPDKLCRIYPAEGITRSLTSTDEHELINLTEVWRKFLLLVCQSSPAGACRRYTIAKIDQELQAIERRCGFPLQASTAEEMLFERFLAIAHYLRQRSPQWGNAGNKHVYCPVKKIPNLLFFEVSNLSFLYTLQQEIPLECVVYECPAGVAPLAFLKSLALSIRSAERNFLRFDSVLFPLCFAVDYRIILPEHHPLIFSFLKAGVDAKDGDIRAFCRLLNAYLQRGDRSRNMQLLCKANAYVLQHLRAFPRLLREILPANAVFSLFVIRQWQARLGGAEFSLEEFEDSAAQILGLLRNSEYTAIHDFLEQKLYDEHCHKASTPHHSDSGINSSSNIGGPTTS